MRQVKKIAKSLLPDLVLDAVFLARRYKEIHGYYPNLLRPKTFNERILHRNLFDTSPFLTQFADKLAVRSYVKDKVGTAPLPQLYWVTSRPCDIPFEKLPAEFVAKPTHGSGWVRLVSDASKLDRKDLISTCETWLGQSYYEKTRERVYRKIVPQILIEEFISPGSGSVPDDYKLYVFGGEVVMIEIVTDRFQAPKSKLFDKSWHEIDISFLGFDPVPGTSFERPKRLEEMIAMAEALGSGVDFVRVDLYQTGDKVYFGEITTSPGAGLDRFDPLSFDRDLGKLWGQAASQGKQRRA